MTVSDASNGISPDTEPPPSWSWATLLAIHPCLTTAAVVGLLLFGLTSTVTSSSQLPDFLPLLPGAPAMIALGTVYLYTPIYLAGLILDLRQVRKADITWDPSWQILGTGSVQVIYFVIPIVQAYDGDTFEELVFGSVELTAVVAVGVLTVRYLNTRGDHFLGAPRLVSLWANVWSTVASR